MGESPIGKCLGCFPRKHETVLAEGDGKNEQKKKKEIIKRNFGLFSDET